MPVSFARLRIAGFKSFAEPALVELRPGLTGIVGPNGCGKSNVVEALRWAMAESSARSMRGGEMEDVIFAGTASRPSRNLAEVTLTLEDTEGRAPPPLQQAPELQISRRIERGIGSVFRVNGREMRARDVQTLFADLGSGARGSAMVSQGRVSALVNARPDERRAILEEAAGISGLHARRHEAELKLRAAEANLARAEDLRGQLEVQLQGLKRQARQASRYRNLSGAIRAAEAELLAIERARIEGERRAAAAALHAAGQAVALATEAAAAAQARSTEAAAALPPLRLLEAAARTALERRRLEGEQIAADEARTRVALRAAAQLLTQIEADLAHAGQLRADAEAAVARLLDEDQRLAGEGADHPARAAAAAQAIAGTAVAVAGAEAEAERATEQAAEHAARGQALAQALAQAETRVRRLHEQLDRLGQEHARIVPVAPEALAKAGQDQAEAEAATASTRAALAGAEHARAEAQARHAEARDRAAAAEASRAGLAAEAQALADVLATRLAERWTPIIDRLVVPAGLEAALGAVLGEELESAGDAEAPRYWRDLGPLAAAQALPAGATPLTALVQAPAALQRALAVVGLVDDASAEAAQPSLGPGQALVTREGGVRRWDGYSVRPGTPSAATVRLQQRNRLAALRNGLAQAERAAEAAASGRSAAQAEERSLLAAEQQARAQRGAAEQRLEAARSALTQLRARADAAAGRLAGLDEQLSRLAGEHEEAGAALAEIRAARAALPDPATTRTALDAARTRLAEARRSDDDARRAGESVARAADARAARRAAIAAERADWAQRAAGAELRTAELRTRREAALVEHAALEGAPERLARQRAEALEALEGAEAAHRAASDRLAEAEGAASAADRAARAAEAALAASREAAVRAEGAAAQCVQAAAAMAERIRERLGAAPALPDPPAEPSPDGEEKARRRLERLLREREEMGAVNLRAEVEAQEIEARIAAITAEREELATAIAKLRGSIGHLNREGRERLTAVFEQVDRNFQALFARMFGGGRAHLTLVGSDDPLLAGLEIYAQPPGKKLAALSLLSGGEQALAALSLIFAVFRCTPAPVCVLDEVDAPLDDANVERFCTLLDDMVRETGTGFLVVTHHHLTMARMDRLYGVTMQERGVSRLLSVDLQAAAAMASEPRMAAE